MIIESDDVVFIVEQENESDEECVVRALRSTCTDEWIVFSENEYGEVGIESITEVEFIERYGKLPG